MNYSLETEKIIKSNKREQVVPSLLLHACCAPCSSACLEYLYQHFNVTVFYYNPNISPKAEFDKRLLEEKRLISEMLPNEAIEVLEGAYNYDAFLEIAKGLEAVPEGGERCFRCYRLRLEETAKLAKKKGFDYFCTTLSISPLKNAQKINEIGFEVAEKFGVAWLPSDFKKKEGYKRSIALSKQYHLYRQNFCGCVFSKKEEVSSES